MRPAKRDTRPEGSLLLDALFTGKWQEVCHLAICASHAGYSVDIEHGYCHGGYPIEHYSVTVGV